MLKRLLKRRAQSGWETVRPTLTWWRMRYADPINATAGLHAIFAHLPSKTVALAMTTDPLPMLWIGVASDQQHWVVDALHRYAVQLVREKVEPDPVAAIYNLSQWQHVDEWPSQTSWVGLLAYGQLYVGVNSAETAEEGQAVGWPAPNGQHPSVWHLPKPQLGTATQLSSVPIDPLPKSLSAVGKPDPTTLAENRFYVGHNALQPVFASGRVQVWGDRHALQRWTAQLILHELSHTDAPLVVIDGRGDMAAHLPLYKPFVAALKDDQLRYVNMDDDLRQQGFNPLQPLAWETVQQTANRWQRWLDAVGIWPSGLLLDKQALCTKALQDGVASVSTLTRWLHSAEDIPQSADVHIQRALRQVQQSSQYAQWLRRPRPLFDLPKGFVFASRIGTDSVHQTMTAAILDAALNIPNVTLLLTGLPQALLTSIAPNRLPERVLMVNGIMLPNSLQGIGQIANPQKRQRMVIKAFGNWVEMLERLTIAPSDSIFWITNPPVQTTS
jgi:hypothetical protein